MKSEKQIEKSNLMRLTALQFKIFFKNIVRTKLASDLMSTHFSDCDCLSHIFQALIGLKLCSKSIIEVNKMM